MIVGVNMPNFLLTPQRTSQNMKAPTNTSKTAKNSMFLEKHDLKKIIRKLFQLLGMSYNNENWQVDAKKYFKKLLGSRILRGVLSIRPCLSVCQSVRPSVFKYLRDRTLVFSNFLREVRARFWGHF